ncbi:MAG: thioredoxin family protein [Bdellovibrionaceae bacterium]|nr:thioredoxin family protein [Pseudobdellovibrionaceae bacterium]
MALTYTPQDELGTPVPDFTLPATDGRTYSLKDFQNGNPLVVMFICNHCPYVKAIEDRLIQLGHDLKKRNVWLVAICANDSASYPDDAFPELKKRADAKKYSFPYLHDESQSVAKVFGAVCTPDFFVYNKQSQLAYRGRLDDNWKEPSLVTQRELLQAVDELLVSDQFPQKQTPAMGCSIKWKKQ